MICDICSQKLMFRDFNYCHQKRIFCSICSGSCENEGGTWNCSKCDFDRCNKCFCDFEVSLTKDANTCNECKAFGLEITTTNKELICYDC